MTKEFVRLFVFDGEESDKLLSSQHTKANQAVEALFKLNNFKNIESAADEFFEAIGNMRESRSMDRRGWKFYYFGGTHKDNELEPNLKASAGEITPKENVLSDSQGENVYFGFKNQIGINEKGAVIPNLGKPKTLLNLNFIIFQNLILGSLIFLAPASVEGKHN